MTISLSAVDLFLDVLPRRTVARPRVYAAPVATEPMVVEDPSPSRHQGWLRRTFGSLRRARAARITDAADVIDHPAFRNMSQHELADMPFPRPYE